MLRNPLPLLLLSPLLGLLFWPKLQSQEDTSSFESIDDLGIISERMGWFRLERQHCAQARNPEAGDAKQICEEDRLGAIYVQEYLLKFSYLPDNVETEFPFGIPLEFQLRIDKILKQDGIHSWQVSLSNRSEGNTISLYQKDISRLFYDGNPKQPERNLEKLQQEQEQEALHFLKGYFSCLRQRCENV